MLGVNPSSNSSQLQNGIGNSRCLYCNLRSYKFRYCYKHQTLKACNACPYAYAYYVQGSSHAVKVQYRKQEPYYRLVSLKRILEKLKDPETYSMFQELVVSFFFSSYFVPISFQSTRCQNLNLFRYKSFMDLFNSFIVKITEQSEAKKFFYLKFYFVREPPQLINSNYK